MERREFIAGACAASLGLATAATAENKNERDYFELRQYVIESEEQKNLLDVFMRDAAMPAYKRLGIGPVGVFYPMEDLGPAYVLIRHASLESFAGATQKLLADAEFMAKGSAFLDADASKPAYKRMEVWLMVGFAGMARLERPVENEGRVFQLRMYESSSVKAGQKKIEMFNKSEIDIFRKTGLNPVFFGENLTGSKMPNLTYMLGFSDMEENKKSWGQFMRDPDWRALRAMPEYADSKIVSNITNIMLRPADYSQI